MNVFIHYLDRELLDVYYNKISGNLFNKIVMSIKVAILLTDTKEAVYIPASNYFESIIGHTILSKFNNIIDFGIIRLVSSSKTPLIFLDKKKKMHPGIYKRFKHHVKKVFKEDMPGIWTVRNNSATRDIVTSWNNNIDSSVWGEVYFLSNYNRISEFQKEISLIPNKLEDKAFVVDYVMPKLKIPKKNFKAREIINNQITKYYIESFLNEFNAVCFSNFFLLGDSVLPGGYKHINYVKLCQKMFNVQYNNRPLYSYIMECNNYQLLELREKKIFEQIDNYTHKNTIFLLNSNMYIGDTKKMKTFIVHGHDESAKLSLKNYIQNTLNLGEPIILSEKASNGLTIIEKFEKYSDQCDKVFVLLTPDDRYTDNSMSRARQNVIFELGYFLGKFGRKSGKIILLYKGELELPNDISGIVYINIDNGIEAAGEEIRRELK